MSLLIIVASSVLASAVAAILFWLDKRAAQQDKPRVAEKTLLLVCAAGGWPGGYWASQRWRHKTQKRSFRFGFALAVLIHLASVTAFLFWTR